MAWHLGVNQKAAQFDLEGFLAEVHGEIGIPTASAARFRRLGLQKPFAPRSRQMPSSKRRLALGKGVLIAQTRPKPKRRG